MKSELRLLTDQIVRLEHSVSRSVSASTTVSEGIERARVLAMLARIPEALELLESNLLKSRTESLVLQGRIHENREEWRTAIAHYDLAERQLRTTSGRAGSELEQQLLRGRAFCWRRVGHVTAAETDYLKLLQCNPSASSHYLLALFYDDVQNATAAMNHARAAERLDSRNFQEASRQLIRNLQDSHFGCFSVYWRSGGRWAPR
ncbi:MAG: hypothetical protein ACKOEO_05005 [Planctomycetaceae bacterium]